MDLKPTFKFEPATAPGAPTAKGADAASLTPPVRPAIAPTSAPTPLTGLGPLGILLHPGDKPATWEGYGFNTIWRPNNDPASDHFLELNRTRETLSFSRIPGEIPNRGLHQDSITMFGITYLDQISDANVLGIEGNHVGLHFEPGIWAIVPATTSPAEPQTVVRMASIPHGTAIIAQGTIDPAPVLGPPNISPNSITPFAIGAPTSLQAFQNESTLANNSQFTTPASQREGVTQDMVDNPNSLLDRLLASVNVLETTTLQISTSPKPVPGGGIVNTAFLSGAPDASGASANALAADTTATIWIMKVETGDGAFETWLQYSQVVLLNFGTLSWPHVTVGSLVLQPFKSEPE